MKRICTVVGARPQLIKAAAVSSAIAHWNETGMEPLGEEIIHTGQHFDDRMSGVFFRELGIPVPVANLGISGGTHGAMTGAMLPALEQQFAERRPDAVLLYGDTNSTLAGALAAAKLCIPVVHVEAGPRMFDRSHPEEINRVVVDHVADLLLAPSEVSRRNLAAEGLVRGVHVVGDVMLDAVRMHAKSAIAPAMDRPFALCTVHRPQNVDDPLRMAKLMRALRAIPLAVLLPQHPRTLAAVKAHGLTWPTNVVVVEPLSYLETLGALSAATVVLSDSGGLPKEAYYLGHRSLTLSSETAWPELQECGATRVVGCDSDAIAGSLDWACEAPVASPNPFGDGDAGSKIVACLVAMLGGAAECGNPAVPSDGRTSS
ncbi:UDP-N-acetylglucosamine 2-epimerase (non-hydrolyzing) [Paramagnetospirillum kuznetsovii]|uniref:UDP-N-acetylglucosamine 2-epimerase (Non-hydrolyzing) n=1 Tax=Paramagnetospirillum kuznetsovii TaxID=2053833 RepID=A0A364NXS2_9PROT|nr:UDP-N-acetylglucosamine 2-epimerase (non-hydrolyzing) [Paramagnetospirillum kuznetsovii]RAU21843.1 UDP-N-acetylglucosamine 2-epimerase (non-hydrolyzing) [Paramagnetospirillum kuznetsovii]